MQIMESWMYNSQGKDLGLPDGMIPCIYDLAKIKSTATKWELESSSNNDSTILARSQDFTENLGYIDSCAIGTQQTFSVPDEELFNRSTTLLQVNNSASHSFRQKAASGEEETGSKNSSSVIDSDTRESSIIDLKLGRFSDSRYSNKSKPIKDAENFMTFASPVPAKRIRSASLKGDASFCQVLNCNMDLSSSKDYYRRHRVCEIHSKTSVVIVNDIEQRFCQQCSRFHLLDAFDDGKRSCRKRLAGHNERRRKPQMDINSARIGRMAQPYHGTAFLGTTSSGSTSFASSDAFPCGIMQGINYDNTSRQTRALPKECIVGRNAPLPRAADGQLLLRSTSTDYGAVKHVPSNVASINAPENIQFDHGRQYSVGLGAPTSDLDNELHDKSFPLTVVSTCAHSLLSCPQPQRSYLYPRAVSMSGQPLLLRDGNLQYGKGPFLDKESAVEMQAPTGVVSDRCLPSRMNNLQDQQMSFLASCSGSSEAFDVHGSGNLQGHHLFSAKDRLAHESGQTVDLLQLSSLLQNVEERRSVQVEAGD